MNRVGIDVVEVAEISAAIDRFGARYVERVYTTREIADCGGDPRRLAARWAAKEAVVKALRLGPDVPTPPREVEVVGSPEGPGVRLHGGLADRARERGWRHVDLSLTHTDHCAAAAAVVEAAGAD